MNFERVAFELVKNVNEEKWQETQAKIQAALEAAYDAGQESLLGPDGCAPEDVSGVGV